MKKSDLRAECTMLEDEREQAAAAATFLSDKLDRELGWSAALAADVTYLSQENSRLKKAIRLLVKSL